MKHLHARWNTGIILLSCLLTLAAFASVALADPPQTINVRGQLLDAQGHALPGVRDYTLQFYSAATGGDALGSPIQGQTDVSLEGLFNIQAPVPAAVLDAAEAWYEIAMASGATPSPLVGGDLFPKRVKVESVPFALQSADAIHVDVSAVGSGTVLESEFDYLSGLTANIQDQLDTKANTAVVYTKIETDALFATKTEVDASQATQDTAIAAKANTSDVYAKTEVDASQATQDAAIAAKANTSDVYTKTQVDTSQSAQNTLIAAKANASDVYTKTQVDTSQSTQDTLIAAKANTSDVYTKAQANARYALAGDGVPSTAIVLSATNPNTNLSGYTCIGSIENAQASPWTATSTTNAPTARQGCDAVWTGTEMIIWGGNNGSTRVNTGARYNPTTDTWTTMTTTNAPTARTNYTAVWTGTQMIVWGGLAGTTLFNTGGLYNPATDVWTTMSTTDAPAARARHAVAWSGSAMYVWGGATDVSPVTYTSTGAAYDVSADTWSTLTALGPPTARGYHSAVWISGGLLIWGGHNGSAALNSGGYLAGALWKGISTGPAARYNHSTVLTGSEMIVWGGYDGTDYLNSGASYNASDSTWTTLTSLGAPTARMNHTAVWTGTQMIVWGGKTASSTYTNTGAAYNLSKDTWTATTLVNAPAARCNATAVWTGSAMVVWGGNASACFSSGGVLAAETTTPLYLFQKD